MKLNLKIGDSITQTHRVTREDFAVLNGTLIHPVYSTYAAAREFEATTRFFAESCIDSDEEGIGTFVQVEHRAPAFEGEEINFKAYIAELNSNELICTVTAHVGSRLIAEGRTGQKILKKQKLNSLLKRNG